eukprot:7141142-Alexandrium_andersonii.AAC.1
MRVIKPPQGGLHLSLKKPAAGRGGSWGCLRTKGTGPLRDKATRGSHKEAESSSRQWATRWPGLRARTMRAMAF